MVVESQSQAPLQGQPQGSTNGDGVDRRGWFPDEVVQLREWGTDTVHRLPERSVGEWLIGSDPSASLWLVDPKGFVSRNHARLVRKGPRWWIQDLRSKNGIQLDNKPRDEFVLVPGDEIGIGGVTLLAESPASVSLRGYLARVLGWDATTAPAVDWALRAIRAAVNKRTPLLIAGADDLVAVARQIHLRTQGAAAPFVVCAPRPSESDATMRVTATRADPAAALERASGGTVCVRAERLPTGFDGLLKSARDPRARAQLVICAPTASKRINIAPSIVVPALADRAASDVERIVFEYAVDAIRELNAASSSFTPADREWVARNAATSFEEIETTTRRMVARNDAGNTHRAAARLGVSHVALGKWLRRRGLAR